MKTGTYHLRVRKDFHLTTPADWPAFTSTSQNRWRLDQIRLNPTKSGLKIKNIPTVERTCRYAPFFAAGERSDASRTEAKHLIYYVTPQRTRPNPLLLDKLGCFGSIQQWS